jgi:hypothetical protein
MWVSAVGQVPGFTAAELEPHAAAVCLGEVRLRDYYVGSSLVVPSGTSVPARCWAVRMTTASHPLFVSCWWRMYVSG